MKYQVHRQSISNPSQCDLLGTVDTEGKDSQTVAAEIEAIKSNHLDIVTFPETQFLTCDENSDYFINAEQSA